MILKIAFIYQAPTSFIEKDLEMLGKQYKVNPLRFKRLRDVLKLFEAVRKADMTMVWFGKLHAFFAVLFSKILRKRIIIIAGGDDVARQTSLGRPYGIFGHPVKKWFGRFIFSHADRVIAISEYNYQEVLANTPVLPEKVILIAHGFDLGLFFRREDINKEDIVVTVGTIDAENYWRKGFYLIKDIARLLPKISFYIIGPHHGDVIKKLERGRPDNLFFPGPLYGVELVAMLSRAKVYLQLSEWESFGCALAEAMLCECVPVVYRGTALPEVIGDAGLYVECFEPKIVAQTVEKALQSTDLGPCARERIVEKFPLKKRQEALLKEVALSAAD